MMIFLLGFMNEIVFFCIERMSVVNMILRRGISEEVYDGRLVGFLYDSVCSCLCM